MARLALLSLLFAAACRGAGRAADRPGQLALQALTVLHRHCGDCHGDDGKPRAGLNVLSRDALVARRKVVQPGAPDASELLDLVAGGSMPPGTHPKVPDAEVKLLRAWVEAGAPTASPAEYTLHYLLADWHSLDEADRRHTRYLSVSHLLDAPDSEARLAAARKDLQQALAALRPADRKGPLVLETIDPRRTVFRIHLERLGWNKQPFERKRKGKSLGKSEVNLYDLLLLEYPYAILPPALFPEPLAQFLLTTKQVRPVPYLRGDWLVAVLGEKDLYDDLAVLLGQKPGAKPPAFSSRAFRQETIGPAEAEAELGWKFDRGKLAEAAREAGLPELAEDKRVSRGKWELHLPRLAERLGLGTAIAPVNGITWPDYQPAAPVIRTIEVIDQDSGAARARIVSGTGFNFRVRVSQPVEVELVLGKRILKDYFERRRVVTDEAILRQDDNRGWQVNVKKGAAARKPTVVATVYAFPQGGAEGFPMGEHLDSGPLRVHDRFVHALYPLTPDGTAVKPPPAGVAKATASFEVE
jgi:mono/diheme cytochrome c family protein